MYKLSRYILSGIMLCSISNLFAQKVESYPYSTAQG